MTKQVLVTGGAGYIGSTVCSALEEHGFEPIVLDSLVTGKKEFTNGRKFYFGDMADSSILETIFKENKNIQTAIHCAALIVVPDSVENPREYYRENVSKSAEFFFQLNRLGCKRVVFSSSASVYGNSQSFVVTEDSPLNPGSPYARTKFMMEMVLEDYCAAYGMQGIALRYFNPIGADPKMRSGIHARFPSHVLGTLVDVALGKKSEFLLTGTNWPTRDGSGIRDYFHVWDLALAHVKAVQNFDFALNEIGKNYVSVNLGTGNGVTVKELLTSFQSVFGKKLNVKEVEARPGDVAGAYANNSRASKVLNWSPGFSLEKAIEDALKWGQKRKEILGYN